MASGSDPVRIPAASLVHGSSAPAAVPATGIQPTPSGKSVPPAGNVAPPTAAAQALASDARSAAAAAAQALAAQIAALNKFLNNSGRPNEFRIAPNTDSRIIQEINPANGAVVGEYPSIAFPALARSLGVSGALLDELA